MKHSLRAALLVSLQLVILVVIAAIPLRTLAKGQVVSLMVEPIDPRDLFRGDYVNLRYSLLSSIPLNRPSGKMFTPGDTIYVPLTLARGPGLPNPLALPELPTTIHPGGLAIRGKVVRTQSDSLHVEYGIESFFVPQGRGQEIERAKGITAEVAIDSRGRAVLRRLYLGTTPFP
jgi:uncharacterized membrane-anchored protein